LFQNVGPAEADGPPRFTDVAADAGGRERARARAAGTFLRADECDFGVDLLVAPARPSTLRVHRFPADSAGRTTVAGGSEATAGRRGGCVVGTDAAERIVGHRVASVLLGGGGDDELVARGGVTVLDGGPGRDTSWHASFAKAMNSTMALFAKWGLVFDYAFRVVEVPSDSDFVADAESDRCRVKLVHKADTGDEDENRTIGKLLAAFPSYYRPGQVNIYVSDVAATGTSAGSGVSWSDPVHFIILRENAGALAHEMGHQIGLAHPYDDNAVPAGAGVAEVESRDSWNARPFPDPTVDRLRLCASDAQCAGVDAPAGDCRSPPGRPPATAAT
jgi:hypothetical protein